MKYPTLIIISLISLALSGCSDSSGGNSAGNKDDDNYPLPSSGYYCRVTSPYSHALECADYLGEWTEEDAGAECGEAYSSQSGILSDDKCSRNSDILGSCLMPKGTRYALTTYYKGGGATAEIAEDFCTDYYKGKWYNGDSLPGVIDNDGELMPEAISAMASNTNVNVDPQCTDDICLTLIIENQGSINFTPTQSDPTTGIIIYPGANVDPRAYAPAAQSLASSGYFVAIVPMPGKLALPNYTRARSVIDDSGNANITSWFMAGHSMGGVAAARFTNENSSDINGAILWATYVDADNGISGTMPVMSIYGTRDGLSTEPEIDAGKPYLPEETIYVKLYGANHAQFGYYGAQEGDLDAGIDREEQQSLIVSATQYLINSVLYGPVDIDPLYTAAAEKEESWPAEIQVISANLDSSFDIDNIEIVTYDLITGTGSFGESKPSIDALATPPVTVRAFMHQAGNPDDLTKPPVFIDQFWVKAKLQDSLITELGFSANGERQLCSAVNQSIIQWAFDAKTEYSTFPLFADQSCTAGPEWMNTDLLYIHEGNNYRVTSPYLIVESDNTTVPPEARGVFYCKAWGPVRAVQWALEVNNLIR